MFLLHNDMSSVNSIHHQCCFVCMIPIHWLLTLNRSLFQFFFTVLFANQIMICSTSAAHVPLVLSCLLNPSALTANFKQVIFPVFCFLAICVLPCLLTRYWFVSCQQDMCDRFRLLYIYGVLANFEQVTLPVLLYLALIVNWILICSMSAALVHCGYLAV